MRWLFNRSGTPRIEQAQWIADDAWARLLDRHRFLHRLDTVERARLRNLCATFLASKAINGAAGFALTDGMVASIAVQACLPVLELGIEAYPAFVEIIVYPSDFIVDREIVDENGVVHAWTGAIAGESWEGGPIVLAWNAISDECAGERGGSAHRPTPFAFNVVIHEFAHKLDMSNGAVDGMPVFSRALHSTLHSTLREAHWQAVLQASLEDFAARVDAAEASIPSHVDPESARADRYFAALPFDAYAATDEGEFFSVTSEAFFVTPERLVTAYPEWYALLAAYYRQDPLNQRPAIPA